MSQVDATAIQQIQALTLSGTYTDSLKDLPSSVAVLPEGFRVSSLESFEYGRFRFRGVMKTTSIADFVRYSIKNAVELGCSCFIDATDMKAVTIFNIGTIGEPGHADNTAVVTLKKTAPFRALLDINGNKNRQKELAEWLEDWSENLMAFDADGATMNIKQAIGAIRRITIESISTSDHEDQDFSAKRSIMESVEAKSKEVMPAAFEFICAPYEGLTERRFKLRYSIIANDTPSLVLRIIQLEAVEELIAMEFRDLLIEQFNEQPVDSFIGAFSS